MKTMTCKDLGGACDKRFSGETFAEIAELSKQHGTEMYHAGDLEHLAAMQAMSELMQSPNKMKAWLEDKLQAFERLTED